MDLPNLNEGRLLVKKAREAVSTYLKKSYKVEPLSGGVFDQLKGIFVTINSYPELELRGCIGFPLPTKPLGEGVVEAAIYAATEDLRFPQIRVEELDRIVFEVSILSKPKLIEGKPEYRESKIKIPGHGLIIEYGGHKGLLLPQVAVDYRLNQKKFLEMVCQKAFLPPEMYLSPSARVYTFEAKIFEEKKPDGEVEEKKLIL
ncbi:MAG: TIGR00296 family protein [Candidatus Anstonellaceae archaeon]